MKIFLLCSRTTIKKWFTLAAIVIVCHASTTVVDATMDFTKTQSITSSMTRNLKQQLIPKTAATAKTPSKLMRNEHDEDIISSTMQSEAVATRGGGKKKNVSNVSVVKSNDSLIHRLKIGFYFAAWYALNIIYNILNKKVLNELPAPLTVGTIQFLVGALYSALLWVTKLRPAPKLYKTGRMPLFQIGFFHSFGQLASMISLGAGPVSFTHIVKALEPFFSALVSALVFHKVMRPQVYASLIPVVVGVGYACLKERYFSWLAFTTAMWSNVAFALRAVCSKSAMMVPIGENMDSANLFGLVTWMAFFVSIPMCLVYEGTSFAGIFQKACQTTPATTLWRQIIVSGLFHYLNNEVMYLALSNVHPVTLAVGNTMKRVFIMVASVLVFRNPISLQAGIGSGVGIGGVLLYSLTKQYYETLDAAAAAASAGKAKSKKVKKT